MTVRFRVGNDFSGVRPARGDIRMVRCGDRQLSSYTYDTLDLSKISPTYPASRTVTIDEIDRFFTRTNDPRMTTGAKSFIVMDRDNEMPNRLYWRPTALPKLNGVEPVRSWGINEDKNESIALKLRLTKSGAKNQELAYFDNALFYFSNILWEFSPDGGFGKWYQLYDLPNRAYTRMTLPDTTNQIAVRAISNNPDEWVQAFAITPKTDYQESYSSSLSWSVSGGEPSIDKYGMLSWGEAIGGHGQCVYFIEKQGFGDIGNTRGLRFQIEDYEPEDKYAVRAEDAGNSSIKTIFI